MEIIVHKNYIQKLRKNVSCHASNVITMKFLFYIAKMAVKIMFPEFYSVILLRKYKISEKVTVPFTLSIQFTSLSIYRVEDVALR